MREAELSMMRRALVHQNKTCSSTQGNLASTYQTIGRLEEAIYAAEKYTLDG